MPKLPQEHPELLESGPYGPLFAAMAPQTAYAASLSAHMDLIARTGAVPRRTKELIAIMVSWLNVCVSCAKSHQALARYIGVDERTLAELESYTTSDRFSEAERAALSAAVALTREPRALPAPLWDGLRAHYDRGACVEIVTTIALYNYVTRLNNALQTGSAPGMDLC